MADRKLYKIEFDLFDDVTKILETEHTYELFEDGVDLTALEQANDVGYALADKGRYTVTEINKVADKKLYDLVISNMGMSDEGS